MKRFDALITTQKKTQLSAKSDFSKSQEKLPKMGGFEKMVIYGGFFLIFSEMGLRRELRFLAL